MAIYKASTVLSSKLGELHPYEVTIHVDHKRIIRKVEVNCDHDVRNSLRPFMVLDLLCNIFPQYLYSDNIEVEFYYTEINHPRYDCHIQPCLKIYDNGEIRYFLLNRFCDESWFMVHHKKLWAMILWWRNHRDEFFKKPPKKWEYERIE